MGPLAAAAIAKVLKNNLQVKKLDLYGNGRKKNQLNCFYS